MQTQPINSAQVRSLRQPLRRGEAFYKRIIGVPSERHRLATAMAVTPMTLSRWANGNSTPGKTQLIHLVQSVPTEHRTS